MLVLTRKPDEHVVIDGGITVGVVEVKGNKVRLSFDAPPRVHILRAELGKWQDACMDRALDPSNSDLQAKPKEWQELNFANRARRPRPIQRRLKRARTWR